MPDDWSIAEVRREDLDRFLFSADDIVMAIGQDGLVANLAKYVMGQPVIGISPDPDRTEGVLTPLTVDMVPDLIRRVADRDVTMERHSMVEARLGSGQTLAALNELFIGHRSHQSARYVLSHAGEEEFQSSSGVIVSTGTGLTGWARSIMTAINRHADFKPGDRRAVFFSREPWPSRTSDCRLSFGEIDEGRRLSMLSRMNEGGVIFADGIEQDFMRFDWGEEVEVALSEKTLNLVKVD